MWLPLQQNWKETTTMNNWMYYLAALVAIVLAAWVIKKVTSCIVKTIAMAVIVAVVAYIYFVVHSS